MNVMQHEGKEEVSSSGPARRTQERLVFSAYELGKTAITAQEIARQSGGERSIITEDTPTAAVMEVYREFPAADFFPVFNAERRVTGYIRRQMFYAALSQNQFTRDVLLKADVTVASLMDPRVLMIDAFTRLPQASDMLMAREEAIRFDPFVITLDGEYYGISTVRRVLDALNYYFHQDLEACNQAQRAAQRAPEDAVELRLASAAKVASLAGPGGDYAGVFELSESLTLLSIFDVCGKGLKASQMALAIASSLRSMLAFAPPSGADIAAYDLGARLRMLNRLIVDSTAEDMYASGDVMLYDKRTRVLQIHDYGHAMVFLRRGKRVYNLCDGMDAPRGGVAPFFGITPDLTAPYRNYLLRPGDVLCACTDGVTEQRNALGAEFGVEGLRRALLSLPIDESDPERLLHGLEDAWARFRGGFRITDDRSWLVAIAE